VTTSTTKPGPASPPPNVQITFGDNITEPQQREAVERSVATLAARSAEAAAQARAAEAERAKLEAALDAPLMKLIEEDPEARKALDEVLTSGHLIDSTYELGQEQPLLATDDVITVPVRDARSISIRTPPYDFTWVWATAGLLPFNRIVDNTNGHVGIDARSGFIDGGASGLVETHTGVGLVFRPTSAVLVAAKVTARSLKSMRIVSLVEARGVGANATSEGGMEFIALEDGRLVNIASAKLWRHRVSVNERTVDVRPPFVVNEPSVLEFKMHPGHEYIFNVGVWAISDRTPGVGFGAAQSLIEGIVQSMTIEQEIFIP
jgi:hypothetical protein